MTAPHDQVGDTLPRLYTVKHAAERWDLSQKTIRRLIEAGEIETYQLERPRDGKRGSALRIAESELLALLDRMRV
jgi:excisionase family DNA binding protein